MVDKGTQCTLSTSSKKLFESSVPRISTSFDSDNCQHPTNSDRYNANVSGDVYHMSIGPTVIYKLDPDTTKKILLGNPDIMSKLDESSSLPSPFYNRLQRCKKRYLNNENKYGYSDTKLMNFHTEEFADTIETTRGIKRCCSRTKSPQTYPKPTLANGNVQTLFTYGVGGVVFNYLIKHRCEKI